MLRLRSAQVRNSQLATRNSQFATPMLTYFSRYPDQRGDGSAKTLSEKPTIHASCHIVDSQIGVWTEIGPNSHLVESTFDDYSYCAGHNSIVYSDVGKFCSIAAQVRINPGNHPMQRPTQHHMTYRRSMFGFGEDDQAFFDWRRAHRCVIGHDVWIGHGAVILPGVTVGIGAIVGAGAIVTKDVEPYMIVGGVAAKRIRPRFDAKTVERLLASAWWEWDHETIKQRFDDLIDMDRFLEKYG